MDDIQKEEQLRLALFDMPDVSDLLTRREDQWLERKSFRVTASDLANSLLGFANADGGRIVVGVRDRKIEGVDADARHLNALLQASLDFCEPPVRHEANFLDCVSADNQAERLLLLDITASARIHRNKKGVCYLRRGDENRQLRAGEERELAIDKSEMVYDQTPVPHLIREDLDELALHNYAQRMKVSSLEGLLHSRALFYNGPQRAGVTQPVGFYSVKRRRCGRMCAICATTGQLRKPARDRICSRTFVWKERFRRL